MAKELMNIKVFHDTTKRIETDQDLTFAVKQAKKKTTVFYEDEYPAIRNEKSSGYGDHSNS